MSELPPSGRREQKKLATREALQSAAVRLFAEQGYEATTVAQIAAAAQVGERTFYRYFDGKENLLAEQALAWIEQLHDAIRNRPADEAAYAAVACAITTLAGRLAADDGSAGSWILAEQQRPIALLRRATPRPMRRLEQAIADAVVPRLAAQPDRPQRTTGVASPEFQAQLLARVAVAALRTAAISHRQLKRQGAASPGVPRLLDEAFEQMTRLVRL